MVALQWHCGCTLGIYRYSDMEGLRACTVKGLLWGYPRRVSGLEGRLYTSPGAPSPSLSESGLLVGTRSAKRSPAAMPSSTMPKKSATRQSGCMFLKAVRRFFGSHECAGRQQTLRLLIAGKHSRNPWNPSLIVLPPILMSPA